MKAKNPPADLRLKSKRGNGLDWWYEFPLPASVQSEHWFTEIELCGAALDDLFHFPSRSPKIDIVLSAKKPRHKNFFRIVSCRDSSAYKTVSGRAGRMLGAESLEFLYACHQQGYRYVWLEI